MILKKRYFLDAQHTHSRNQSELDCISDKFKLTIKNKTQSYTINFTNGSYYASDISKIIDDEIKKDFNNISEN